MQTANYQGKYDPTVEAQKVSAWSRDQIHELVQDCNDIDVPHYSLTQKLWQEEVKPLMLFPWIYIFILIFPSMNRYNLVFLRTFVIDFLITR